MDAIRGRYGVSVEVYFPGHHQSSGHGAGARSQSVLQLGGTTKAVLCGAQGRAAQRALKDLSAWMTGLSRDQAVTRNDVGKVEMDEDHGGIVKINPLADWSHDQVWQYIGDHNVPYNRLHTQGYPSIGCAPCTRAVQPGDDLRAGRWWWENPETKECGLHYKQRGDFKVSFRRRTTAASLDLSGRSVARQMWQRLAFPVCLLYCPESRSADGDPD